MSADEIGYRKYRNPETQKLAEKYDQLMQERFNLKGNLYTVDLPDEKIAQMLDWDKPFSEQSAYVQKAIMNNDLLKPYVEKMNAKTKQLNEADPARLTHPVIGKLAKKVYDVDSMKGQDAYNTIASHFNSREQASEFLRQAGIPGIKYLDAGSRDAKQGTRNFVVFPGEEKHLKILERK
jgi:viroplasmin and RNaseH domain-containing protein